MLYLYVIIYSCINNKVYFVDRFLIKLFVIYLRNFDDVFIGCISWIRFEMGRY